jgi:hypothetical protein
VRRRAVFLLHEHGELSVDSRELLGAFASAQRALFDIFKRSGEKNFFDRVLYILPNLFQATARTLSAYGAQPGLSVRAARFSERTVHQAKDVADRDLLGRARQRISAMHAPAAIEDTAAFQLQQNLLEILQRNVMAFRDVVNSHDFGILHRKMQDRLGGVLAFGCHSHNRFIYG